MTRRRRRRYRLARSAAGLGESRPLNGRLASLAFALGRGEPRIVSSRPVAR